MTRIPVIKGIPFPNKTLENTELGSVFSYAREKRTVFYKKYTFFAKNI